MSLVRLISTVAISRGSGADDGICCSTYDLFAAVQTFPDREETVSTDQPDYSTIVVS